MAVAIDTGARVGTTVVTPGSSVSTFTRGSALACWRSSPSIRSISGARPPMTARAPVTSSRETAGSSSPASQPRPGPVR